MSRRSKRASMREGPLADLFRSTSDDETAEGSDRSTVGPDAGQDQGVQPAGPVAEEGTPPSPGGGDRRGSRASFARRPFAWLLIRPAILRRM